MIEVIGVDGFRLDAVKHAPAFFWRDFFDDAMARIGPGGSTPFSFGEVIAGNNPDELGKLRTYTCKNGIGNCKNNAGNRDVLDFPLLFTMQNVLNGSGGGAAATGTRECRYHRWRTGHVACSRPEPRWRGDRPPPTTSPMHTS